MTEQTNTKIPAPLYAAAGAGDLAYEQLRKLPAVVSELSARVNELSGRVNELSDRATASLRTANEQAGSKAASLRDKAGSTDFDALRNNATTTAVAFAQIASERAVAAYTALVARGERVVGSGVVEAADVVNADIETTEEPKAVEATPAAVAPAAVTPATVAPATTTPATIAPATAAAKPRKRATKSAPAKNDPAK